MRRAAALRAASRKASAESGLSSALRSAAASNSRAARGVKMSMVTRAAL